MRAIVQDRYGPPLDVLELREVDRPSPGPGEVLVRVRAAGVDPGVWHLTTGRPYLVRLMGFGLRRPGRSIPGSDLAGTVEAVGAGVTRLAPGDDVYGVGVGSFAEYAVGPEKSLARKPANLTFEQAAAVPISGWTALQGLRDTAGVRAGQRVLILGAGGGVGTFAVQLAVAFGAEVTGVCSGGKADLVRSLGAEHVVDYTREDPADGSRRYDVVLDTAGNRTLRELRRALTPQGTLVLVGGETDAPLFGGFDRHLRAVLLSPFVRPRLRALSSKETAEDLDVLTGLIESGALAPVVDGFHPLDQATAAIDAIHAGHARGKSVITP